MKKKFCLALILFLVGVNLHSQERKIDNSKEKKKIKESVGMWQGVKGNDTFTIFLQASVNHDTLIGWHHFKKNGVVESSTMSYKGIHDSSSILYIVSNTRQISGDSLNMAFHDPNRSQNMFLVNFDVKNSTNAKWTIFGFDMSEGQYSTYTGDVPPTRPLASEIMKVKEWTMTKLQ